MLLLTPNVTYLQQVPRSFCTLGSSGKTTLSPVNCCSGQDSMMQNPRSHNEYSGKLYKPLNPNRMLGEVSLTLYTPWREAVVCTLGFVRVLSSSDMYHHIYPKSSAPQTLTSKPQASKPLSPKCKILHGKSTARSPKPMKTLYPNNAITTQISILIRGRPSLPALSPYTRRADPSR